MPFDKPIPAATNPALPPAPRPTARSTPQTHTATAMTTAMTTPVATTRQLLKPTVPIAHAMPAPAHPFDALSLFPELTMSRFTAPAFAAPSASRPRPLSGRARLFAASLALVASGFTLLPVLAAFAHASGELQHLLAQLGPAARPAPLRASAASAVVTEAEPGPSGELPRDYPLLARLRRGS